MHIEIGFDCPFTLNLVKRAGSSPALSTTYFTAAANVPKPVNGGVVVPLGTNALCINLKGTILARSANAGRLLLVAPRSLTFIRGGARLAVQAARGEHEAAILSWPAAVAPALEAWVASRSVSKSGSARMLACRPIEPLLTNLVERIEAARRGPDDLFEPMILSTVHEAVASLLSSPNEMQLATVPAGLPETIQELIKEVRVNPAASWPLKDAADKAGYSPFHFSRVFKQLVGYGFHEYVDRCRTETAVEMLVTSDNAVDLVASACGFGTTQGLRESVKEYLGLVPSELRNMPEVLAH